MERVPAVPIREHFASLTAPRGANARHHLLDTDFSAAYFQQVFMDISGQYPMKALHTQEVRNIHIRHCRERKASPPPSRYANASRNTFASWRSAVSNPSVNQP
jgi:hypothetical protein